MARLSFGVCFAPDPPPSRWVDLTKLAEAEGFDAESAVAVNVPFPPG